MRPLTGVMLMTMALAGSAAGGVERAWTNGSGDGRASTAGNWKPTGTPQADDTVVLDGTAGKADLLWDAAASGEVAGWRQTEAYEGTVTIATAGRGAEDGEGLARLTIAGDCVLQGGVWRHRDDNTDDEAPWRETSRLRVHVGGRMTIGEGARIDATALGFRPKRGPGGTDQRRSSASHGGLGSGDGPIYGSVTAPTRCGSGGDSGRGGGAICLTIDGALAVEKGAAIIADGEETGYGTGSGGSISIKASALRGGGTIRANGGRPKLHYGAGGGGRVAVVLTGGTLEPFAGTIEARTADRNPTGAGTVYLETRPNGEGEPRRVLVVDNAGHDGGWDRATPMPEGLALHEFDVVRLGGKATLAVDDGNPLDWSKLNLVVEGPAESRLRILGDAEVQYPRTLTVRDYTLIGDGMAKPLVNIEIDQGVLSHGPGGDEALNLTIAGDLTVTESGRIDVDAKGRRPRQGPGAPEGEDARDVRIGGSHGGRGSDGLSAHDAGPTYGSIFAPETAGSGGDGGRGGGVARLEVGGEAMVAGAITARGEDARNTGAGGSVYLSAGALSGAGVIRADGGAGRNPRVAGGGGRVAVVLSDPAAPGIEAFLEAGGIIRAAGGPGNGAVRTGAAGTVYLQPGGLSAGRGRVVIDNAGRASQSVTELPPAAGPPAALDRATVHLRRRATVALTAEATVLDLTVDEGCTLDLAGRTLTVRRALRTHGERHGRGRRYSAGDLAGVTDSSEAGAGRIIVRPVDSVLTLW